MKYIVVVKRHETTRGKWHVVLKFSNGMVFMHSEKYLNGTHARRKAKELADNLNAKYVEVME
jgi:uncharacterized protein YegP (UPF0339 family)